MKNYFRYLPFRWLWINHLFQWIYLHTSTYVPPHHSSHSIQSIDRWLNFLSHMYARRNMIIPSDFRKMMIASECTVPPAKESKSFLGDVMHSGKNLFIAIFKMASWSEDRQHYSLYPMGRFNRCMQAYTLIPRSQLRIIHDRQAWGFTALVNFTVPKEELLGPGRSNDRMPQIYEAFITTLNFLGVTRMKVTWTYVYRSDGWDMNGWAHTCRIKSYTSAENDVRVGLPRQRWNKICTTYGCQSWEHKYDII